MAADLLTSNDSNTNTGSARKAPRRIVVALAVAVIALVASVVGPTTAGAYQTTVTGRPGTVLPYQVEGRNIAVSATYGVEFRPGVKVPGARIYRTPGSVGNQNVAYIVQFQKWNGSGWVVDRWFSRTAVIPATSSFIYAETMYVALQPGYYTVNIGVSWANGAGMTTVHMNAASDYLCVNSSTVCGAGWVYAYPA